MKNGLKKALVCAACVASSSAFANHTIGGAYLCNVSIPGSAAFNVYVAVVTNDQGVTGIAPLALTPNNLIWGYGTGPLGENAFSGQTNLGQPYSFVFNPQALSLSGTVGGGGTSAPTTLSCSKVF